MKSIQFTAVLPDYHKKLNLRAKARNVGFILNPGINAGVSDAPQIGGFSPEALKIYL